MKIYLIIILSSFGDSRVVTSYARSAAEAIESVEVSDTEHISNCVQM